MDAADGRLLVHGGHDGSGRLADIWAYQLAGNSWTKLLPSGAAPEARCYHVAAMDAASGRLLVHGGLGGGGNLADLWAYNLGVNSWTQLAPSGEAPGARYEHAGALDAASGKLLVHGGYPYSGQLWAYHLDANSWTQLSPSGAAPSARNGQVAAMDAGGGKLLVHGGMGGGNVFLADIWAYDLAGNSWTQLLPSGAAPEARCLHVAAMDAAGGRLLVQGGSGGLGATNTLADIWALAVPLATTTTSTTITIRSTTLTNTSTTLTTTSSTLPTTATTRATASNTLATSSTTRTIASTTGTTTTTALTATSTTLTTTVAIILMAAFGILMGVFVLLVLLMMMIMMMMMTIIIIINHKNQ